jgi:hypothetical protein
MFEETSAETEALSREARMLRESAQAFECGFDQVAAQQNRLAS